MLKVLFVCLGNICRSPMAEGLFLHYVKQAQLEDQIEVDSAGTGGWHVGELPDSRMRATAKKHNIPLPSLARKAIAADFAKFDYILAMDASNYQDLQRLADRQAGAKAQLFKMRYFDEQAPNADVPDPYWGGDQGFENVYQMLDRATQKLLAHIREEQGI
ncbi:MAG: low molecular weight protein-tyrosine-phosphatase [Bacteroidota bacterium]